MKWRNLLKNCCPKDGEKLEWTAEGWQCTFFDPYHGDAMGNKERCKFFIKHERAKTLKDEMRNSPRGFRARAKV